MPTPLAAKPTKCIFDPFNSSATGHQCAESRLSSSTSWRDSRSRKLREQFTADHGSGKRLYDAIGAGSLDFGQDGRKENGGWESGAKGLRRDGQRSLAECAGVRVEKRVERPAKRPCNEAAKASTVVSPFTPFRHADGTVRESSWTSHECSPSHLLSPLTADECASISPAEEQSVQASETPPEAPRPPQLFAGVTVYINGSTAPAVSDHMLKRLLARHGAKLSIALGRRTVTHVILGRPASASGAGGGLAGSKIQREIARTRGKGVKFVTAEWVLQSIKASARLAEGRFEALRLAPHGVRSAASFFEGCLRPSEKGGAELAPG